MRADGRHVNLYIRMSSSVLTFVIVGLDDHPIFEADLVLRGETAVILNCSKNVNQHYLQTDQTPWCCCCCSGESASRDDRTQYLHQFVLHAALDAVEDQQWQSTNMNLGIVDKFNNLQVCLAASVVPEAHVPVPDAHGVAACWDWALLDMALLLRCSASLVSPVV